MSETPANPAPYYRGRQQTPESVQLRLLVEGYYGLCWIFLLNVVLAVGHAFFMFVTRDPMTDKNIVPSIILLSAMVAIVGYTSYGPNRKIGEGLGWPSGSAVIASVLVGLNSVLCAGILGYAIIQHMAFAGMIRFGVKGGFFGYRKSDMMKRIDELEQDAHPGQSLMDDPSP